jgi:hypothetical protein
MVLNAALDLSARLSKKAFSGIPAGDSKTFHMKLIAF